MVIRLGQDSTDLLNRLQATEGNLVLVRAATTATLAASVAVTSKTIENAANGALGAQDGVSLSVNDRLLVRSESNAVRNGVYEVTSLGSATTKWLLTRIGAIPVGGMEVRVLQGTKSAATAWTLTTTGAITLGTTELTFALVASQEVGGVVSSTGTIESGKGFTVAHGSTGQYVLTFVPAFVVPPTTVASPLYGSSAGSTQTNKATTTSVTVQPLTPAGSAVDAGFSFISKGL